MRPRIWAFNAKGVPVTGVLTSAVIIAIAVVVVFVWPEFAFNYLMSIATIAGIINWTMIMFTEMKFRKVVAAGAALPRIPSWPASPARKRSTRFTSSCRSPK